jgi:hypothetical protein
MNANLIMDNRFDMINVFNDIPIAYTLTMETFGGGISTLTVNTGANFEGNLTFPFAGFVGGANLANIDRISLGFESGRSGDVSIGSLSTVPEPASAGLAVLGGLGLLLRRRRS